MAKRSSQPARDGESLGAALEQPAEVAALGRSAMTREKLLVAATKGFARTGYDGYSSRMIAADSGVHHALIAYHFGGKLGLWKACLLRIVAELRRDLDARQREATDDAGRLRIIFEEFIRHTARNPEFQQMSMDAVGRGDGRFDWVLETIGHNAHESWRRLIESAQAAGRFVPGDAGMLLNIFLGAAIRIYIMAPETERNLGRSPFDPQFIEEHVQTCVGLFFRG